MRKLVHIKWLVVAIFLVTLGACGTDELTQRTVQPASVEEERVDTIRLQLDFPTINFRSEITAVEEVRSCRLLVSTPSRKSRVRPSLGRKTKSGC